MEKLDLSNAPRSLMDERQPFFKVNGSLLERDDREFFEVMCYEGAEGKPVECKCWLCNKVTK